MPKKTLNSIVESGNHFTVQVKGNTSKLRSYLQADIATQTCLATHTIKQKENGIKTIWQCYCYEYSNKLLEWNSIKTIINVHKKIISHQSTHQTQRLYASSAKLDSVIFSVEKFNLGIKGHWGIENQAHKNKDVVFKQDSNKVKNPNHAVNRAIMNTIAINILTHYYGDETITFSQILFRSQFEKIILKNRT